MAITMSSDNKNSVLDLILVAATRQRDLPKFVEWAKTLANQIIVNDAHSAVAGPVVIDGYMSENRVDFHADPYWGPGTTFLINGSARNDGTFTIESKDTVASTGNIDFIAPNRIKFTVDPLWSVGMSFTVAGSALNNFTFVISQVIGEGSGTYVVTGHAVLDEVSGVAVATNTGITYKVVEAIDVNALSDAFVLTDFTTPDVITLDNAVADPDWLVGATIVISGADYLLEAGQGVAAITANNVELAVAPTPNPLPAGFQFTLSHPAWTSALSSWEAGTTPGVDVTINMTAAIDYLPVGYQFDISGEDRVLGVINYYNGVISTVAVGAALGEGYAVGDLVDINQGGLAAGGTVEVATITAHTWVGAGVIFTTVAPFTDTITMPAVPANPGSFAPGAIVTVTNAGLNNGLSYTINTYDAVSAAPAVILTVDENVVAEVINSTLTSNLGAVATITLSLGGADYSIANGIATVAQAPSLGNNAFTINITAIHNEVALDADPFWSAGVIFETAGSTTAGNDQEYTVVSHVGIFYTVTSAGAVVTEVGLAGTSATLYLDDTYTVVSNAAPGVVVATPAAVNPYNGAFALADAGGSADRAPVAATTFTVVANVGLVYQVAPDPAPDFPGDGNEVLLSSLDGNYVIVAHVAGSYVYQVLHAPAIVWPTMAAPATAGVVTGATGVATSTIASISDLGGTWFHQKFLYWFRPGDFSNEMLVESRQYYTEEFWTSVIADFNTYGTVQLETDPAITSGHIVEIFGSTSNDGLYTAGAKVSYVSTGNITFTAAHTITFATDPATISPANLWTSGMRFEITGSVSNDGIYTIDSAAGAPAYTVLETVVNEGAVAAVATSLEPTYPLSRNNGTIAMIHSFVAPSTIRVLGDVEWPANQLVNIVGATNVANNSYKTVASVAANRVTFTAPNLITFVDSDPWDYEPNKWKPEDEIVIMGSASNNLAFTIVSHNAGTNTFTVSGNVVTNEALSANVTATTNAGGKMVFIYTMNEATIVSETAPSSCYGQAIWAVTIDDFKAANVIEFDHDPHWPANTVVVVSGSTSNDGVYTVNGNAGVDYTMNEAVNVEAALATSVGTRRCLVEAAAGELRSFA